MWYSSKTYGSILLKLSDNAKIGVSKKWLNSGGDNATVADV